METRREIYFIKNATLYSRAGNVWGNTAANLVAKIFANISEHSTYVETSIYVIWKKKEKENVEGNIYFIKVYWRFWRDIVTYLIARVLTADIYANFAHVIL